jgi:hypothetical protein
MFEIVNLKDSVIPKGFKIKEGRNFRTKILVGLVASVLVGAAVTVISGFIQTPPMAHLGVDVVYWGLPLSWTMRVIPTRFQSIDWFNLVADLVFWVMLASIVSTTVIYLKTKRNITRTAPPSSVR